MTFPLEVFSGRTDLAARVRVVSYRIERATRSIGHRSAVRTAGRAARRGVTDAARVRAEQQLLIHLRSLHALSSPDLLRRSMVGVFVAHDGEPNLGPLIADLRAHGATVALPTLRDDPDDFSMTFTPWFVDDRLSSGRFGIPVPPPRPAVELDVVLVSFVAFDRFGNRMGRGAGFFDRYLAATSASVIGVGFEVQRIDEVPVEPHDIALPVIVTDLGVRYCTPGLIRR